MLHALAILGAAETGHEKSKTVFYICAGLLAGWAVVLAAIGMSHATFPQAPGAQRVVQLISVVLVAAAMATAVATA
jgi:hypothetical protein